MHFILKAIYCIGAAILLFAAFVTFGILYATFMNWAYS